MAEIDDELKQLAENVPNEVLQQINSDEKVWNKRFKWVEYNWTGYKTGRTKQLSKKYRENGTGPELTEEQFTQKRKEYFRDRLKALQTSGVSHA